MSYPLDSLNKYEKERAELKRKRPVWFFCNHTLGHFFWDVKETLNDVKWWVLHRTVDRYHVVRCDGLEPGYYDTDTRMFHAIFGLLKDYVEVELAIMNRCLHPERKLPWWYRWVPFTRFRSAADGLAHLEWECGLISDEHCGVEPGNEGYGELSPQAISAREERELYLWYTSVWPIRSSPNLLSGWSYLCKRLRLGDEVPEEEQCSRAKHAHDIAQQQYQEDNAMLKRLIDVRSSMWT